MRYGKVTKLVIAFVATTALLVAFFLLVVLDTHSGAATLSGETAHDLSVLGNAAISFDKYGTDPLKFETLSEYVADAVKKDYVAKDSPRRYLYDGWGKPFEYEFVERENRILRIGSVGSKGRSIWR